MTRTIVVNPPESASSILAVAGIGIALFIGYKAWKLGQSATDTITEAAKTVGDGASNLLDSARLATTDAIEATVNAGSSAMETLGRMGDVVMDSVKANPPSMPALSGYDDDAQRYNDLKSGALGDKLITVFQGWAYYQDGYALSPDNKPYYQGQPMEQTP